MLKALESGRLAPVFECGFRPFFLGTALSAVLAMAAWLGFWLLGTPLPAVAGGPVVWHAHELVFGFALASITGFTLTAVPEFTGTAEIGRRPVAILLLIWIAGRIAYALAGTLPGAVLAMVADIALVGALLVLLGPRLVADPEHRHHSFAWALAALLGATIGFHRDALAGDWPMRWIHVMTGVLMILIIIAMSRISMRIVNEALDAVGETELEYLARPPRRNLAISCIALCTAAEFLAPGHPVSGWLALAAAAAVFNLTSDWHVGRALLRRWPLILYLVYWSMALGYGTIGIGILADEPWSSAGRHLLLVGAMGLAIFAVLNIAGRIHAGVEAEPRPWAPLAAGLLVTAALVRAAMGLGGIAAGPAILVAGACWIAAYGMHLVFNGKVLAGPRTDGLSGCAEYAGHEPPGTMPGEPARVVPLAPQYAAGPHGQRIGQPPAGALSRQAPPAP